VEPIALASRWPICRHLRIRNRLARAFLRAALWWYARPGAALNRRIHALDHFLARFMPRRVRAAITTQQFAGRALGELTSALGPGDVVSPFVLTGHDGERLGLDDLSRDGLAVVAFLRGGWCPPCNLELRALARLAPQLSALGARLAVLSPERPGQVSSFENVSPVAVPILEDRGNVVARAFGIAQRYDGTLAEATAYAGVDLGEHNGDASLVLPVPAVYVIDRARRIHFAYRVASYIDRLEPDSLLAAVRAAAAQARYKADFDTWKSAHFD